MPPSKQTNKQKIAPNIIHNSAPRCNRWWDLPNKFLPVFVSTFTHRDHTEYELSILIFPFSIKTKTYTWSFSKHTLSVSHPQVFQPFPLFLLHSILALVLLVPAHTHPPAWAQPPLPSGLYTCTAQGIWKNELVGEKMPRCLPGEWKPSTVLCGLGSHALEDPAKTENSMLFWFLFCAACYRIKVFKKYTPTNYELQNLFKSTVLIFFTNKRIFNDIPVEYWEQFGYIHPQSADI